MVFLTLCHHLNYKEKSIEKSTENKGFIS